MREQELGSIYVIDEEKRLTGYVTRRVLRDKTGKVDDFLQPTGVSIELTTTLRDAFSEMLVLDYSNVCVVDSQKHVRGVLTTEMIQKAISESKTSGDEEN